MSLAKKIVDSQGSSGGWRLSSTQGEGRQSEFKIIRTSENIHALAADTLTNAWSKKIVFIDPKVDGVTSPGTFISSSVITKRDTDQSYNVSQVLTNVKSNITESDYSLQDINKDPSLNGSELTRYTNFINPYSIDTLTKSIENKISISNPKADNNTYSGTYVISLINAKEEEDKTYTIIEKLTKVTNSLSNSTSHLYSSTYNPEESGTQVVRGWQYVNPLAVDTATNALSKIKEYTNVSADSRTFIGKFVQSSLDVNRTSNRCFEVKQTFTLGRDTTDSSNAHISNINKDPKIKGFNLVRSWNYILPSAVESLTNTLSNTTTYSSFKVNDKIISGSFIVGRAKAIEQEDKTYKIEQLITKAVTPNSSPSSLGNPTSTVEEKQILHPFTEGTGNAYSITYTFDYLNPANDTTVLAYSDTSLLHTIAPAGGYKIIDKKVEFKESDRTMDFIVLVEKKVRSPWSGTASYDRMQVENNGRKGEIRKKYYYGIQYSDHDKALNELQSASNCDSGFITIGDIKFTNDDEQGAKNYEWTQIQKWSDTQTDSAVKGAFSISQLKTVSNVFSYHNYNDSSMPDDPSVDTANGFRFIQKKIDRRDNGLLDKIVIHESPRRSNSVDSGIPSVSNTLSISSTGTFSDSLNNAGKEITVVASRIDPKLAEEIVNKWSIKNDSNFKCIDINVTDHLDGSGDASKRLFRFNKDAHWFISKTCDSTQGRAPTIVRTWPYVEDTKADVLMSPGSGAATKKWTHGTDSYTGGFARRQIHFGLGLSTIEQESIKVKWNQTAGVAWNNFTDTIYTYPPQFRRIRVKGVEHDQIRTFEICHQIKQTTDYGQAYRWTRTRDTAHHHIKPTEAHVEDHSVGKFPRFRAIKIYTAVDSWTDMANGGYSDLGSRTPA